MRLWTANVHAQTSTSDMTSSANLHLHHPSLLRGVLCSMSDGVNDVEVAKATVMSEASAEGSTVAAGQATQTDSRSEAGGEAAQPLASNGLDQQTQPRNQAMMPPPKRMPPPMFKSPTPPIAKPAADSADATGVPLASPVCQLVADVRVGHLQQKQTGAPLARAARAQARTAAVAAAAAAAKSSLPAQRERAVAEAAARVRFTSMLHVRA